MMKRIIVKTVINYLLTDIAYIVNSLRYVNYIRFEFNSKKGRYRLLYNGKNII